ncbi:MAG TPA: ribosome biogenesis GTPase Der [Thermodesulfobacteriota bacterium]|nr:ribosome biogenesis GTPase Der [Thermodesulfobacteriota bacterium]
MNRTPLKRKPIVAIVGRPNVGKSTLFNRIIGWQKAIVEDIPGVTRDRNYGDVEWGGTEFTVVDTGGLDTKSEDLHLTLVKDQVRLAIEEADLIIFLLDAQTGVMPQDVEALEILRKTSKPILYAINKVDHEKHELCSFDFHALGIDNFINISAVHGINVYDLLDTVVEHLPAAQIGLEDREENIINVAVIGKPNVGKSTLINKILGEERLLTSPVPGTTRDTIDTFVERDGKKYVFIDTAGIRRKSKITFSVEKYSVLRAIKAIEKSDIVLFMVDSQEGPTHQDARLGELIKERNRGCVILLNKWDLVPQEIAETPSIDDMVRERLKALDFAPVITISALTGKRVNKIFDYIDIAYGNFTRRIATKPLNNLLESVLKTNPPPSYKGVSIKFYYISQPMTKPPTFVVFTNSVKGIPENYKRFLENRFRSELELEGTPIKFIFRARRK